MRAALVAVLLAALLSACAGPSRTGPGPSGPAGVDSDGPPDRPIDLSQIPDAVPKDEPRSRYGNPASYEVYGERYFVLDSAAGYTERGVASWYGSKFHGKRTSSGEPYDMYGMTAAHRVLPLPTYLRVTNLRNGRSVIVKANDRGPFARNRIIDLSYAAAAKLDMLGEGTAPVEIQAVTAADLASSAQAVRQPTVAPGKIEYYVQVGAFADRDNAERLRQRLESQRLGASARISSVSLPHGSFHRVWVGPVASVAEADRLFESLGRLGYSDTYVIVPPQAR